MRGIGAKNSRPIYCDSNGQSASVLANFLAIPPFLIDPWSLPGSRLQGRRTVHRLPNVTRLARSRFQVGCHASGHHARRRMER